jgi:phosphogluconate dehydratase
MTLNPVLETVTERIKERSLDTRRQYLARMANAAQAGPARGHLSCSNLAHGMAACASQDKNRLTDELVPNIAIVTALAVSPRCVMGSLKGSPAWICRCFREM